MALPKPEEYDARYFDGATQMYQHNGGYGRYVRNRTHAAAAQKLFDTFNLSGKKVLEVGCAKGFVVKSLRDLGVDAHGIDISSYAVSTAEAGMSAFLTEMDARTGLTSYADNEFFLVYSMDFLECLSNVELASVKLQLDRIASHQCHKTSRTPNTTYYADRTDLSATGISGTHTNSTDLRDITWQ